MLITPVFYSVLACLFWGLIFIAPLYLANFDCIDIVLGRFLAFGTSSAILLTYFILRHRDGKILTHWKSASLCAIVMNLSYFTALTIGMRLSNPSLITLIVGLAPIVIAGLTYRTKALPYSILVGPILAIFIGMILLNIETLQADWGNYTLQQYVAGILCGFFALGAWSWYVIYNTRFLQGNPLVKPLDWTLLIGVVTLLFTLFAVLFRWWTADPTYLQKFSLQAEGLSFIAASLVLGLLCSLVAFTLWNLASAKLPSALSGQLATLETVFGLVMINAFQRHIPTFLEMVGMLFILGAIWRGLYNFNKIETSPLP